MQPINRTFAPLQAFVEELRRSGMTHAVTSPGSRNAPLVLALAAQEGIEAVSVLDERSAGFVALGMAKASGRPVAVTCTSGTAGANLYPAVVEAHEARVPLIVLTGDRPPELRDTGAGQAIDQIKLYGSAAKWFVEVGNHDPSRASAVHHRALACRAYLTAGGGRPGPVHLNFPLREPLAPEPEAMDPEPWQGRRDGRPWVTIEDASRTPAPALVDELAARAAEAPRGVIVCGAADAAVVKPAARLAAAAGWPLLAEPTSGLRRGPHDHSHVVAHYDALLRADGFAAAHRPDLVLRIGDTPTSKPLRAWLPGGPQIVIDPHAAWNEPTRAAEMIVAADPAATCDALAGALELAEPPGHPDWVASWRAGDALVPTALASAPDPSEPKMCAALAAALPPGATLWVSSSMPVRDLETFMPQGEEPLRVLANRGANGIDGIVSSALGAVLSGSYPLVLLTGELALLHDLSGLVAAHRCGISMTIVCLNNGGGGIFRFLPLAASAPAPDFDRHVLTPAGLDLRRVAALFDLPHAVAATPDDLRAAVRQPGLVEVRTDGQANVEHHRRVFAAIHDGLPGG